MTVRLLKSVTRYCLLSACCVFLTACNQTSGEQGPPTIVKAAASSNAPAAAQPGLELATGASQVPVKPNPKLQSLRLFVGPHELKTELALTDLEIRTGMMFRQSIGEDEAMLFVFPFPHRAGFWMKNVDIPLSCAYIDPQGVILEIHDMAPHEEKPIEAASARVQFVLETKQGWFERHDIKPGVLITTEQGSLKDSFRFGPAR